MNNKTTATKYQLIPKLRFPEFQDTGEWQEKILGKEGKFLSSLTGKTGKDFSVGSSSYITYMNVFSNTFVNPNSLGLVDVKKGENQNSVLKGDVFFTVSSETPEEAGMSSVLLEEINNCYLNSFCIIFRFFKNKAPNYFFLGFLLRQPIVRKYFSTHAQGSTRFNLSKESFRKLPIYIPSDNEQQKIADCLTSLDDLITAETQKLESLEAYKKGLLQNLFPAEGQTIPALRFPEFQDTPEWEKKPLGKLGDIQMCKRIYANETNDSEGVPFYKIGTLGKTPDAYITRKLFEEYKTKYNYPRKGEILITCSGTVGNCLPFDGYDGYFQDSNIVWVDNPTLEISNEFLYYTFLTVNWSRLNSTTITRIYGSDLRTLSIQFPKDKKEQQIIVDCLSSADKQISSQAQMVETLQAHKKGLLQQLFPSSEED